VPRHAGESINKLGRSGSNSIKIMHKGFQCHGLISSHQAVKVEIKGDMSSAPLTRFLVVSAHLGLGFVAAVGPWQHTTWRRSFDSHHKRHRCQHHHLRLAQLLAAAGQDLPSVDYHTAAEHVSSGHCTGRHGVLHLRGDSFLPNTWISNLVGQD